MGDLIERLRQQAAEIASVGHNGWGNTMTEAADELARLRAEVDDYANASKHSADDLRARDAEIARLSAEVEQLSAEQTNILQSACEATDEVNRLRKMNEGMRQQYATDSMTLRNLRSARDMQRQRAETAERERDELRRRIAEAETVTIQSMPSSSFGVFVLAPKWVGQRVALVRLDAEEGGSG